MSGLGSREDDNALDEAGFAKNRAFIPTRSEKPPIHHLAVTRLFSPSLQCSTADRAHGDGPIKSLQHIQNTKIPPAEVPLLG